MEQRYQRLNAVCQQLVYQVRIELQALFVDLACAVRQNSGPADGETVIPDTHFFHHLDVFFEMVVVVTGNVAFFSVRNVIALLAVSVPDVQTLSVCQISTLYLVCCGCGTPHKIVLKFHIKTS